MAKAWTAHVGLAVFLVVIPVLLSAQTGAGSIAGTVKDATGAVLPGVTVLRDGRILLTGGSNGKTVLERTPPNFAVERVRASKRERSGTRPTHSCTPDSPRAIKVSPIRP